MSEVVSGAGVSRVGDVERNACVDRLTQEMVAGRLGEDEFDARVEQALRAQTQHDLDDLTADLVQPSSSEVATRRPAEPVVSLSARDVVAASAFTAVVGVLTLLIATHVTFDSDAIALWLLLWLFGEVCGLAGALLARGGRRDS